MDNLRFLMIVCVVFGHMLETIEGDTDVTGIYRFIYSFHMPVFIFISGFFARFRPNTVVRKILLPYVIFHVIYVVFDFFVIKDKEGFNLQFSKPYWLLWYLLTLFFYNLLLPLFQTENSHAAWRRLTICVLVSLIAGFDKKIGYSLSLSRTLVFLPFFVAGHYCASFSLKNKLHQHRMIAAVASGAIILVLEFLFFRIQVPVEVFYGSLSYSSLGSNCLIRFLFLICGFSWILFFLSVIPNKELTYITGVGQRTLPIFLLHGFVQRIILNSDLLQENPDQKLLLVGLITVLLITVLSIPPINNLFKKLF